MKWSYVFRYSLLATSFAFLAAEHVPIDQKNSRIMIIGMPGAGKSTCALQLHQATGIPLHHLDKHYYVAGWANRNYEEFLAIQQSIVDQDSWIIDGNCIESLAVRFQRATTCLYFNDPLWKCIWRVYKRLFYKHPDLDDKAPGCPEAVKWGLLSYMWSFKERVTPRIEALRIKYPHVIFIEIKNFENNHSSIQKLYEMIVNE